MESYHKIKELYSYEDGDTITPSMGVQIDTGYGLQQYVNPTTGKVIQTKFADHNATLFPQPYSSRKGSVVVPATTGQQWYLNAITDEGAILENGVVKAKFAKMFKVGTVKMNNNTFPALIIIGDLVNDSFPEIADRFIYYVSSYENKQFTCQKQIQIQQALAEACQILVSVEGENGAGDEVLSNDNDWVQYTCFLQQAGNTVTGNVNYKFQKLDGDAWKDCKTITKETEVGTNSIKLYDAAIDGAETYRCIATYNGQEYIAIMNPTDEHDPYYIVDGCNIAGDAVKDDEKVTFNPTVYDRHTGAVSTGWTFSYTLYKRTDGTVLYASVVTISTLTGLKIREVGGINVRITASRD